MKVKDYLRQPNVKWVNHVPTTFGETCLVHAVVKCYTNRLDIWALIAEAVGMEIGEIGVWNDTHTKDDVLALVDRLDI